MPRKSRAALEMEPLRVIAVSRPLPPSELSAPEGEIWRDVVGGCAAGWFKRAHYPILMAYCRHSARASVLAVRIAEFKPEWLAEEGGLGRLDKLLAMAERETRALTACARTLRLTHQSPRSPTTAATAARQSSDRPRPWDL